MKKTILLCLSILMLSSFTTVTKSQTHSANQLVDSTIFYYRTGSTILYEAYSSNASALERLNRMVAANRPAILSGNAHFELLSYIPSSSVGVPTAINAASIQASVVRSYLKTQYGIPHSCSTFAIDTTQGAQNKIQVQLISGPIPLYANKEINYSEDRSSWAINQAFAAYQDGIPYASYLMILASRNNYFGAQGGQLYALRNEMWQTEDWDNFADTTSLSRLALAAQINLYIKTADGDYVQATQSDVDNGIKIIYSRNDDGTYSFASLDAILAAAKNANNDYAALYAKHNTPSEGFVSASEQQPYSTKNSGFRNYPIFGFKTNLLYWAVALPNLELEFYFGKSFSISLEGEYTWLSEYLPVENAYYFWGVNGEFRYWFERNSRYEHWYLGVYGNAGQYDFKFNKVGNQGDYYSVGLTAGYVLPIGKHFNVEFGLGVGYIHYTNSAYVWNAVRGRNEWQDPNNIDENRWNIFPTKAKISLLWKF